MHGLSAKADKLMSKNSKRSQEVSAFIDQILSVTPVYIRMVTSQDLSELRAVTYTLIDAMKLQLVESMIEHKRYRACEQCGKPFELTPQVNRADRIYCTDNCRVKAWQRRSLGIT
jgi:hypothetical protein